MKLRCFKCGRLVPDRHVTAAGHTDLGDTIWLCWDCEVPPHTRASSRVTWLEPRSVRR